MTEDPKESLECKVQEDFQVQLEMRGRGVPEESWESQDLLDHQENLELLVVEECLDQMGLRASKVKLETEV